MYHDVRGQANPDSLASTAAWPDSRQTASDPEMVDEIFPVLQAQSGNFGAPLSRESWFRADRACTSRTERPQAI
jgi:hypothetical protein